MPTDGVAIHRQALIKTEWRTKIGLAPTPDSFSYPTYITMICFESSRLASRNWMPYG